MKKIFTVILCSLSLIVNAQSGIIWSAPFTVATSTYGNLHPRITLDRNGNPLVIWGEANAQRVYFTRWNGSMFTTPVVLNTSQTIATSSWMGPDIASKGDTVYVVMKETPENMDTLHHTYIVHSYNGGMTFSMPLRVEYIHDSICRFPAVTCDNAGNPVVGFMKFDSAYNNSSWAVTKSNDFGMTFTNDVNASGWSGGAVCDCCPATIISSGNTVAMLYRDKYNNIRDMWAGISNNGGNSFSNGFEVDNTNWNLNFCPSSGPDGLVIGDTLYSTWMSGATGLSMVYYSKSSLSNLTSGSSIQVTGQLSGLAGQNYPRIASCGNAVALAWEQSRNGNNQLGLFFTNNINNGFPALFDTVWTNNITNTDIAIGNGEIHVVWEDDNGNVVRYRKGTFAIFTSTNEIKAENNIISIYPNPASSSMTIHQSSPSSNQLITITNILGEEVYHQTNNSSQSTIDVSNWSNGVYFYQLTNNNETVRGKFVKE